MDEIEKSAILISLPLFLHEALKQRAAEERRSMNSQAIIAIEEHLRLEENAAPKRKVRP